MIARLFALFYCNLAYKTFAGQSPTIHTIIFYQNITAKSSVCSYAAFSDYINKIIIFNNYACFADDYRIEANVYLKITVAFRY